MTDASKSKHQKDRQIDEIFEPRPSLKNALTVGLQGGAVGVLVSAVQNALGNHNKGAAGVITRTGGTIGIFAAMAATFVLTDNVVANTRRKSDVFNGAAGGCAAGFLAGLRARSFPVAVASCAMIGGAVAILDTAGNLAGERLSETADERRRRFFKQETAGVVFTS